MEICFKIRNGLFPKYLHDLVTIKQSAYDVRAMNNLCIPKYNTITYGKKRLKYICLLIIVMNLIMVLNVLIL